MYQAILTFVFLHLHKDSITDELWISWASKPNICGVVAYIMASFNSLAALLAWMVFLLNALGNKKWFKLALGQPKRDVPLIIHSSSWTIMSIVYV